MFAVLPANQKTTSKTHHHTVGISFTSSFTAPHFKAKTRHKIDCCCCYHCHCQLNPSVSFNLHRARIKITMAGRAHFLLPGARSSTGQTTEPSLKKCKLVRLSSTVYHFANLQPLGEEEKNTQSSGKKRKRETPERARKGANLIKTIKSFVLLMKLITTRFVRCNFPAASW